MGPFGSDIKVENFVDEGVPVLNGSNLTKHKLVEDGFKYVTAEKAKSFKKAIAKRGDIVVTHRGTLGQISFIPDNSKFEEYVISQSQFRVALNRQLVDPAFFVYYFHTSEGQKRLLANKCHVGVPALAQATTNFKLVEIPLPTLSTQQKIASVLTALDAKIELNHRINAELEAMAKTLYDYWFVQFDFPCLPSDYRPSGQVNPSSELTTKIKAVCTYRQTGGLPLPDGKKWFVYVLLCEDGSFYKGMTNDLYRRYYEHATGQGAQHTKLHKPRKVIHYEPFDTQQEAAKREQELKTGFGRTWIQREYEKHLKHQGGLPAPECKLRMAGKMVWNEVLKREVPEGWEIGSLLDIAEYANGIPCQKFRPTGNDYFRVIKIREMNEGFSQNSEFVRTDIPEKAKVENGDILFSWSASLDVKIWTGGKGALNQHIFKVTSREYPKSFYFHQLLNYLQHFKMMAENRKTTMGHITQEHLEQSRIVLPPKNLTFELEKKIAPLFSKKVNNEVENQTLTELRDWLLPMLMNGQVKVSEL